MSARHEEQTASAPDHPLCVDLDGCLLRSDLLVESVFGLLRCSAWSVFLLPLWLLRGRAHLKHRLAQRVELDVARLPYHQAFLGHLAQEHAAGRRLVLATASNRKYAEQVARHLGIFSEVLASDQHVNLSGPRKLERLRERFGTGRFEYAGNARADLAVWEGAGGAIAVNPAPGVIQALRRRGLPTRVFEDAEPGSVRPFLQALRFHQWLKNLVLFVPLLMAHRFDELQLLGQGLVAFLAFGLCVSSVYLFNDLMDLPDDRQHPHKRHRPFARGALPVAWAVWLIPLLPLAAAGLGLLLPLQFLGWLALYYGLAMAYSLGLKREAVVDVLTLAGLYIVRLLAGAAAVAVQVSFWLLAFALFLFLSLALLKRFTELRALAGRGEQATPGRDYAVADAETLAGFGAASAYLSVLVLALYINSQAVTDLYPHPQVIWLLCPLLLYLLTRLWLLARRGLVHEDPVLFVIQDRRSQWTALLGACLLWLAA